MILSITILLLFLSYSALVLYYWRSWENIPIFSLRNTETETKVNVIIPARNEEENIANVLAALKKQSYTSGLFEIIVVDDHSTDATTKKVMDFPGVKIIHLLEDNINSYKKKAIEAGIAASTGELIVTTDADCIPGQNWLQTIACFKEENKAEFIAAPVVMVHNSSILQIFQAMDFTILQAITGAVVTSKKMSMCNGANIAYTRNSFFAVDGFKDIDSIASGDDMLLMHKISKKYPDNVFYLKSKEAIVSTLPMKTWRTFFNQRIRWASKARKYQDRRVFPVLLIVYLFNLSFGVLAVAGLFKIEYRFVLIGLLAAKVLIELPIFISASRFFNQKGLVKYFILFQPLHICYTIIAGLFSQFGKYEWKGRKVN